MSLTVLAYSAPLGFILIYYLFATGKRHRRSRGARQEAVAAGLTEPSSLHPLIDPAKCLGCGACVTACPEGDVLGLIDRKAELIDPTRCIGHGACKTACPMDAISLVFGTEARGVDIPLLSQDFETNVAGIFIAGELGGMGLIRNAITQGRQAVDAIRKLGGIGRSGRLDVVIVGAGPAGFAASLGAMQHKLRFATIEQDSLGGTVSHYPRGKVVMTAPVELPLIGKVKFGETTKEKLLEFWEGVEKRTGLAINYHERLETIEQDGDGFVVKTSKASYPTRSVLLAIGRRGTPRKLGVPGEDQAKVVYRLIDPEQYRGQRVLVTGGGDSALEAATSIAEEPGTTVTISYRGDAFSRSKPKNRRKVDEAAKAGRLNVVLGSTVKSIGASDIEIARDDEVIRLDNDAVIVCAGGELPTPFLKSIGITIETKHGTA